MRYRIKGQNARTVYGETSPDFCDTSKSYGTIHGDINLRNHHHHCIWRRNRNWFLYSWQNRIGCVSPLVFVWISPSWFPRAIMWGGSAISAHCRGSSDRGWGGAAPSPPVIHHRWGNDWATAHEYKENRRAGRVMMDRGARRGDDLGRK